MMESNLRYRLRYQTLARMQRRMHPLYHEVYLEHFTPREIAQTRKSQGRHRRRRFLSRRWVWKGEAHQRERVRHFMAWAMRERTP